MDTVKVEQFWSLSDMDKVRRVSWLSTSYFSEHAVRKFMGSDFHEDLVQSLHMLLLGRLRQKEETSALRGLALVCGDMEGEKLLFQSKISTFCEVDGIDISEVSLQRAIENCKRFGFKFNPLNLDCNAITLRNCHYDLIVGNHGIHHVQKLDNLFTQISHSLKPHGLFYCNEYVGPNYLQIPFLNRLLASFFVNAAIWPPSRRITHENKWKLLIRNLNFRDIDPSEAVRSEEIIKIANEHLNVFKLYMYGGLNYPAFEGIGHHFKSSEGDEGLMKLFIAIEKALSKLRLVKPLFCYLLADKKPER